MVGELWMLFAVQNTTLQLFLSTQCIVMYPTPLVTSSTSSIPKIANSTPLHILSISPSPLYTITLPHSTTLWPRSDTTNIFIQTSKVTTQDLQVK